MLKAELIKVLEEYLNVEGRWFEFARHIQDRGYSLEDIGLSEEDIIEEDSSED